MTSQDFLVSQTPHVDILAFLLDMGLDILVSAAVAFIYVRYGRALANRALFARNLVLISMTTCLIITVVKSSLALSLGLVGALSIVRFRTPIKEPEELAYLFLAIAVGVGLGANQPLLTLVGFGVIAGILVARRLTAPSRDRQNLHLSVAAHADPLPSLPSVVEALQRNCRRVNLRRCDESRGSLEASFLVELEGLEDLERCKSALRALDPAMKITFLEAQHLPSWN